MSLTTDCAIVGLFLFGDDILAVWLKLDGVTMPTPSGYTYVEADFDSPDSTRSETGVLTRDRIRRGVMSPELTWSAITTEQLRTLLNACVPEKISVQIFDPLSSTYTKTFTGYAQATRKASVVIPRKDPLDTLWSISISFIEY